MSKTSYDNFRLQEVIVIVGLILMTIKFFAYYISGSLSILTDAMESIINVIAACVSLFALYLSSQPPDKNHPFGHGKVEIVSATIEGIMISTAGLLIILKSAKSFFIPYRILDLDIGLILIAIAAIANFMVGHLAIQRGRIKRSIALESSGKHLCSDTYSSIGIIIGLLVVYVIQCIGYNAEWLDSFIAVAFGIIILKTGVKVLYSCINDVMDKADFGLIDSIICAINDYRHSDWIDIYNLKIIKYGSKMYADVNVVFPRWMTVYELYIEKRELEDAVMTKYNNSIEISMTPIPCRDFNCRNCRRDCDYRETVFEKYVIWNRDTICCDGIHYIDYHLMWRK